MTWAGNVYENRYRRMLTPDKMHVNTHPTTMLYRCLILMLQMVALTSEIKWSDLWKKF